ncbi:MAG: YigZ family protein [candidate division Zixibacteria bacterium]|nr:YigZ family protein [candidate division Zixibacteria bacterium]
MDDRYQTIAKEARSEIKVKGSRFIGESFLVSDTEQALEKLSTVRKREHAASHHCFAWRVGIAEEMTFKYSDAGEPVGTAGKPIYDVIAGREITNVLLVVTRYFGGTKLGTGGLARAYSDAAKAVLEQAGVEENFLTARFKIELDFSLYDRWQKLISNLEVKTIDSAFTDRVAMILEIRLTRAERLQEAFTELTGGKGKIEQVG